MARPRAHVIEEGHACPMLRERDRPCVHVDRHGDCALAQTRTWYDGDELRCEDFDPKPAIECPECGGSGVVYTIHDPGIWEEMSCPSCGGDGEVELL